MAAHCSFSLGDCHSKRVAPFGNLHAKQREYGNVGDNLEGGRGEDASKGYTSARQDVAKGRMRLLKPKCADCKLVIERL